MSSSRWFVGDHHFGHRNIQRYENRPDGWEELIVTRHNEVVGVDDIVYFVGDVSFYGSERTAALLSKMNGRKTLVLGNHDRGVSSMLRSGFAEVYGCRTKASNLYIEPQFSLVVTTAVGTRVALSHAPLISLPRGAQINVHGHVHSNPVPEVVTNSKRLNVSVDVTDFYPYHESVIDLAVRIDRGN